MRMYGDSFQRHGDSPASMLTPKGRNDLRFRAIDPFVATPGTRVLDYGCGLGYLYSYLQRTASAPVYTGFDMLPEFVSACQSKFPGVDFRQVDVAAELSGTYDVVFASGVFNLRSHDDLAESKAYAFDRIERLFALTRVVLVCDFLSAFVDFQQPDAQHYSAGEIADFCSRRLGRRFQLRHDLLPYEFTLIAWKDSRLRKPDNIYEVDA